MPGHKLNAYVSRKPGRLLSPNMKTTSNTIPPETKKAFRRYLSSGELNY